MARPITFLAAERCDDSSSAFSKGTLNLQMGCSEFTPDHRQSHRLIEHSRLHIPLP